MIRLRKKNGQHFDVVLDDVPFVELVNDFDNTVMRLIIQSEPGVLLIVEPNTTDAARYEALMSKYGVKFTPLTIHKKTT